MIRDLVAGANHILTRQQTSLHSRGKLKVVFQRSPLPSGQMIQADADQRVGNQAIAFHGIVADLANPE